MRSGLLLIFSYGLYCTYEGTLVAESVRVQWLKASLRTSVTPRLPTKHTPWFALATFAGEVVAEDHGEDERTPLTEIQERLQSLCKEQEWIGRETERLAPELDRIRDGLRYALITAKTPAGVTQIEKELEKLEPQAERLRRRRDAYEKSMTELEDYTAALRESQQQSI